MLYPSSDVRQLACLPFEYYYFRYIYDYAIYVMIYIQHAFQFIDSVYASFETAFSLILIHVMYVSDDTYWVYFHILTTLIFFISRQGHSS